MQKDPQPHEHKDLDLDLVLKAKEDDPVSFSILSERYQPYLQSRASRYSNVVGVDTEDFVQEGMLALYRAVKGYNPSMGILFRTYAFTCINNSMVSAIKTHMRTVNEHEGIHLDEMDEHKLYQQASHLTENHPEDVFFRMENENYRARQMEALLSEFEQHVLKMYLSGQSYQSIAKALCTTTKAVDNALQRVRRKLRPEL